MVEITNIEVYNLERAVIASGNAMRLEPASYYSVEEFEKGLERCKKLAKMGSGTGHSNFRTGILVTFDLKYPQYFTKQLQRYHWVQYVSSTSMMHRITKMDFDKCCNEYVCQAIKDILNRLIKDYNDNKEYLSLDENYKKYMEIVSNCPMGAELTVHVSTNYEQLATIYKQRKNHKLKEDWGAFCKFIESLPYAKELIICKESEVSND